MEKSDGICRSPSNCQNTFHFEHCGKDGRFRSWAGFPRKERYFSVNSENHGNILVETKNGPHLCKINSHLPGQLVGPYLCSSIHNSPNPWCTGPPCFTNERRTDLWKKTMAISCYTHVFHAETVVISYMRDCWTSGKATLNLTMSWSCKNLDEAGWLSKKPGTTCSSQLLSSHWAPDRDSVAWLPWFLSCCRQSPNWYSEALKLCRWWSLCTRGTQPLPLTELQSFTLGPQGLF